MAATLPASSFRGCACGELRLNPTDVTNVRAELQKAQAALANAGLMVTLEPATSLASGSADAVARGIGRSRGSAASGAPKTRGLAAPFPEETPRRSARETKAVTFGTEPAKRGRGRGQGRRAGPGKRPGKQKPFFDVVPLIPVMDEPCKRCGKPDDPEAMLMCDGAVAGGLNGLCNAPYHFYCVGLEAVPEGDWFCPVCSRPPGACDSCGKLEDDGSMLVCHGKACNATHHYYCLGLREKPRGGHWFCPTCASAGPAARSDPKEERAASPSPQSSDEGRSRVSSTKEPPASARHSRAQPVDDRRGGRRKGNTKTESSRGGSRAVSASSSSLRQVHAAAEAAKTTAELQELQSQVERSLRDLREEKQAQGCDDSGRSQLSDEEEEEDGIVWPTVALGDGGSSGGGGKRKAPANSYRDEPARALTEQEKADVQEKIDSFDDERVERVLRLLREELGVGSQEEEEVSLDIDSLSAAKQRRFLEFVEVEYRQHSKKRRVTAQAPAKRPGGGGGRGGRRRNT